MASKKHLKTTKKRINNKMKTKLLLTLACLLAANFIFADSSDYDHRVKRALIDQDIKYEIDDDGDFKVIYTLDDDRTQLAWIFSETEKYRTTEVREVRSLAYISEYPLSSSKLLWLLKNSNMQKIGGWVVEELDDGFLVVFVVKLDADASSSELEDAIRCAVTEADDLEAEWDGGDDY